jgi:hypothetical protein
MLVLLSSHLADHTTRLSGRDLAPITLNTWENISLIEGKYASAIFCARLRRMSLMKRRAAQSCPPSRDTF